MPVENAVHSLKFAFFKDVTKRQCAIGHRRFETTISSLNIWKRLHSDSTSYSQRTEELTYIAAEN
jgi:hypothetical protein